MGMVLVVSFLFRARHTTHIHAAAAAAATASACPRWIGCDFLPPSPITGMWLLQLTGWRVDAGCVAAQRDASMVEPQGWPGQRRHWRFPLPLGAFAAPQELQREWRVSLQMMSARWRRLACVPDWVVGGWLVAVLVGYLTESDHLLGHLSAGFLSCVAAGAVELAVDAPG